VHSDAIDVDSWPQPTVVMAKKNLRTMQFINVLTCCKIDSEPSKLFFFKFNQAAPAL